MIETSTLKIILTVLLAFSLIWLLRVILKRESENMFRAVVLCLIFGGALFLVQKVKSEKFSFSDLKRQLFPAKAQTYRYRIEKGPSFTRYLFDPPNPKLSLTMDSAGKYFHITDVSGLNAILEFLHLPAVSSGAKELASITGLRTDLNIYRWEDYPLGTLVLERGIYTDKDRVQSYHSVLSITIKKK